MLGNHDILWRNKANKALQATMYANIGTTSLIASAQAINNSNSVPITQSVVDCQLKLIKIANDCNNKMSNLPNESQEV